MNLHLLKIIYSSMDLNNRTTKKRGRNNNNNNKGRNNGTIKRGKIIIPLGIPKKNILSTKQHLTKLSLMDAKHDFGNINEDADTILQYLPDKTKPNISSLDQIHIFKDIHGFELIPTIESAIKDKSIKIELKSTGRNYNIKGLGIDEIKTSLNKWNKIQELLGDKECTFFIDTDTYSLLELLKDGVSTNDMKAYLINNRETMCDPGSKTTNKTKPYLFKNTSGVSITQLDDADEGAILYSKYNDTNNDILNDFYSELDITIGPIKNLYYTVTNHMNPKKSFTNYDPKKENSISSSKKKMLVSKGDFEKVLPYIQKRSGDWLQGLSSLQHERNYMPHATKGTNILVTIDQAFLAYALYIGANVLFCQKPSTSASENIEASYIYFQNTQGQSQLDERSSLKLFYKNNNMDMLKKCIDFKDDFIELCNVASVNYTNILQKIITDINSIYRLFSETDKNNFNKYYYQYIKILIQKILFNKKINLYYTKYENFNDATINVDTEEIDSLRNKYQFINDTKSLMAQYGTENLYKTYMNELNEEYKSLIKQKSLEYIVFKVKIKEDDFTDIPRDANAFVSIQNLYKFLKENDEESAKNIVEAIYNRTNETIFKTFNKIIGEKIFALQSKSGGVFGSMFSRKSPFTRKVNSFKKKNHKSLKNRFSNMFSRKKNKSKIIEENEYYNMNEPRTPPKSLVNESVANELLANVNIEESSEELIKYYNELTEYLEKNETFINIENLEAQFKDDELYESINYVDLDYSFMEETVFINTNYYSFIYLQEFLNTNKDADVANRFIKLIFENLNVKKEYDIDDFLSMFNLNNLQESVNKILELDDSKKDMYLEVIQNFCTEDTYNSLF